MFRSYISSISSFSFFIYASLPISIIGSTIGLAMYLFTASLSYLSWCWVNVWALFVASSYMSFALRFALASHVILSISFALSFCILYIVWLSSKIWLWYPIILPCSISSFALASNLSEASFLTSSSRAWSFSACIFDCVAYSA